MTFRSLRYRLKKMGLDDDINDSSADNIINDSNAE
jgi:hypothetical protein